jgi:signal transduction histidine kinase
LGSFALVIAIALGASGVMAAVAARTEIQKSEREAEEQRLTRLEELLVQDYLRNQGWQNTLPMIQLAAHLTGQTYWVVDENDIVVIDSQNQVTGRLVTSGIEYDSSKPIVSIEGRHALLLTNPRFVSESQPAQSRTAEPSITRYLVWGGVVAAVSALILTFLLSGRILAPVAALSRAARRLSRGDFSQRVRIAANDEVGELTETFNRMSEELGRTQELRRNMVADVAHELRTPLTNIRGFVEAMHDGVMEADGKTLKSIHEEVMLLTRLVEDLQDLSLAEAGQLKLDMQKLDLSDLARRAVDAARTRADAKRIQIDASLQRAEMRGDSSRLVQLVSNLVTNAINYTPEGGRVEVVVARVGDEVVAKVVDTGIGIPQEELLHIFERFYRVDKSRTRSTGGVGLGLTIVKRLAEAHGGRVDVQSEVGKGSVFTVAFPAIIR